MPLLPVAVYGQDVPPGQLVPAEIQFPATIRITMAAIDPTAAPEADEEGNIPAVHRSTLKIIRVVNEDDGDDEDEDEYLQKLLGGGDDDESDEESEEEANGGPSDPAKSKKAKRAAAIKKLMEATQEESDEEMEDVSAKPNGKSKGKAKAEEESDEESDEDDEEEEGELEEFVVCTLDTERTYQQPIDLVIGEGEKVFFAVTGTHTVYVTGNYVVPEDDEEGSDEESDEDYDEDMRAVLEDDSDDMSDELDEIDGAERIKEIDTDEEEAPKLVDTKKSKKRAAEEAESLDELIAKDEKKPSKKQKKTKPEPVTEAKPKESPAAKGDKKVQFAKNLEQGPTGPAKDKAAEKKPADKKALGVKVVNGVTIDDRKVGTGRTVKNGDRVGLRYIGKLQSGKVFDSNKKGSPFSFKIGKGEVIKGWDIGILGMAVGGERRLTIPAHLAYGSRSVPGIPANSTLTFDVKLIEIK
ncbi:putative FK506-binding protein 4 [Cercophora samala]|uniref:FK506-binding protein n=1 Tax=Cercophora samala TaxID=330535 RepID=A0AA39ZC74_9PEZI|nr:putative FK506-binding protein 4 [Cercophora samala]